MSNEDDDLYLVTLDKWGEVNETILGPMKNLDDVKKAFNNLKNCAGKGRAYDDALKDLFDDTMLSLARSTLSNDEKIALVMDMRKYFAGLITAGEVEHDMIMRLASGIK
jgi:hypothetical protein